jgi:hypothetical protein
MGMGTGGGEMKAVISRKALSKLTRKLVDTTLVKKIDGTIYGKVCSSSGGRDSTKTSGVRVPAHLIFTAKPVSTICTPTSTYFTYNMPEHIIGHFTSRSNNTVVTIRSNVGILDDSVLVEGPMGQNFVMMLDRLGARFPDGVPKKGVSRYP